MVKRFKNINLVTPHRWVIQYRDEMHFACILSNEWANDIEAFSLQWPTQNISTRTVSEQSIAAQDYNRPHPHHGWGWGSENLVLTQKILLLYDNELKNIILLPQLCLYQRCQQLLKGWDWAWLLSTVHQNQGKHKVLARFQNMSDSRCYVV